MTESSRGRAEIYYFPPLPDGYPTISRPHERIQLTGPSWVVHRPFWFELIGDPVPILRRSNVSRPELEELRDQLLLVVDRNVRIETPPNRSFNVPLYFEVPEGVQRLPLRFPLNINPAVDRPSSAISVQMPQILVHRVQNLAQVPQAQDDDFSFLQPTSSRTFRRNVRDLHVDALPDESGGVTLSLVATGLAMTMTGTETQQQLIAGIRIRFIDPRREGAFFHRIQQGEDGRVRVDICVDDQNMAIDFYTNELWADLVQGLIESGFRDIPEMLLSAFADWDIRFTWRRNLPDWTVSVRSQGVPRPGSDDPLNDATPWPQVVAHLAENGQLRRKFRVRGFPSDVMRLMLDVAVGFFDPVGDLIEIGELVLALSLRRNRWGERVSTGELMLMGLGAVTPLVPSGLARAPRLAQGRELVENLGLDPEELSDLVRARRTRLAAALEQVRQADTVGGLGDELASRRELINAVSLAGVRDTYLLQYMAKLANGAD